MADLHVSVTLQGFTNIPEDRYMNGFNFTWIGEGEMPFEDAAPLSSLLTAVAGFYTSLDEYLSPVIVPAFTVRAYRWSDPTPRVPITRPSTLGTRATNGLVEEAAFVLGFRGAPPHTRNRRGRIYLGPLGTVAYAAATGSAFSRIEPAFAGNVLFYAQTLGQTAFDLGYLWCITNRLGTTEVPIAQFTYDLSPDTQRRRGYAPTARILADVDWATP